MITIPATSLLPITAPPPAPEGDVVEASTTQPFLAFLAAAVAVGTPPPAPPLPAVELADLLGDGLQEGGDGESNVEASPAFSAETAGDADSAVPAPALPPRISDAEVAVGRVLGAFVGPRLSVPVAPADPLTVSHAHLESQATTEDPPEVLESSAPDATDVPLVRSTLDARPMQGAPPAVVEAALMQHNPAMPPQTAEPAPAGGGVRASSAPVAAALSGPRASGPSVGGAMAAAVLAALPPSADLRATQPIAIALQTTPVPQTEQGIGLAQSFTGSDSVTLSQVGSGWEGVVSARVGGAAVGAADQQAQKAPADGTLSGGAPPSITPGLGASAIPVGSEALTLAQSVPVDPATLAELEPENPRVSGKQAEVPIAAARGPGSQGDAGAMGADDASHDSPSDGSHQPPAKGTGGAVESAPEPLVAVRTPWIATTAAPHAEGTQRASVMQGQMADPPSVSTPVVTSHVTVELDPENTGAQRVRVAIRGDVVNAIVIADATAVEALRPQLTELRQALEGHGFREANVQLRTTGEGMLLGALATGTVDGRARVSTPFAQDAGNGEASSRGRQHARDQQSPRDSGHPEYEEERP